MYPGSVAVIVHFVEWAKFMLCLEYSEVIDKSLLCLGEFHVLGCKYSVSCCLVSVFKKCKRAQCVYSYGILSLILV